MVRFYKKLFSTLHVPDSQLEDNFHKPIFALSVLITLLVFISFFTEAPGHKDTASVIAPYAVIDNGLEPDISADSVYVTRLSARQILYSKNPEIFLPIASITKLMTAILLIEHNDPFELVEISRSAKVAEEEEEKTSPIPAGELLKTEDILKLMLMDSYSDSARAAAEHVSKKRGGIPFAELMNEKAKELGMNNSMFDNPVGLDSVRNYSTSGDLAGMTEYITKKHPRIWDISRIYETDIFSKAGNKYHLANTNRLLAEITDIVGTKTGSTDGAKESLVLVVNILKNDPIVFVILRSEDRIKDAKTLMAWVKIVYGL